MSGKLRSERARFSVEQAVMLAIYTPLRPLVISKILNQTPNLLALQVMLVYTAILAFERLLPCGALTASLLEWRKELSSAHTCRETGD